MAEEKLAKIDKKTQDYVEKIFSTHNFNGQVIAIRYSFNLPKKGLDVFVLDELIVREVYPRVAESIVEKENYILAVKNLLKHLNLSAQWFDFLSDYIQFGYISGFDDSKQIILLNLGNKPTDLISVEKAVFDNYIETNPIALLIPPYASIREITDFIQLNLKNIQMAQVKYKLKRAKIEKTRRKNPRVKERDHFIFKNRLLPKKEIVTLVHEKYRDFLDYTYISKIIKKESRKRSVDI